MLNGQAWPRHTPWYTGPAAFGGIGPPCMPTVATPTSIQAENGSSQDKKGNN